MKNEEELNYGFTKDLNLTREKSMDDFSYHKRVRIVLLEDFEEYMKTKPEELLFATQPVIKKDGDVLEMKTRKCSSNGSLSNAFDEVYTELVEGKNGVIVYNIWSDITLNTDDLSKPHFNSVMVRLETY